MPKNSLLRLTVVASGIVFASSIATAQQVASRATLQSLLSSSSIETFEGFATAPADAIALNALIVDAASQNTYPMSPYLRFISTGYGFQVNNPGYYGMPSTTFESEGSPLTIQFLSFTQAFGLDVRNFAGYASSGSASVYDGLNNLLGTFNFAQPDAPASDFVGWQNTAGIGKVVLSGQDFWSPIVDDIEFGTTATVVPEPASVVLVGAGLVGLFGVARRKRAVRA